MSSPTTPTSHTRRLAHLFFVVLLVGLLFNPLLGVSPALALEPEDCEIEQPGAINVLVFYDCLISEEYLGGLPTDWNPGDNTAISWLPSKSYYFGPIEVEHGDGIVVYAANGATTAPYVEREIYLPEGLYVSGVKFGTNDTNVFNVWYLNLEVILPDGRVQDMGMQQGSIDSNKFNIRFTNQFTVTTAGVVTIRVISQGLGAGWDSYIDKFVVGAVEDTFHPIPGTQIPTQAQPTPAATGSPPENCRERPTLSLTPVFSATATPTPLPDSFAYSISDGVLNGNWQTISGAGVVRRNNINRPLSPQGVVGLQYHQVPTTTLPMWGIVHSGPFPTTPFYVTGWAQNTQVAISETTEIVLWATGDGGNSWSLLDAENVGSVGLWYPFQFSLSSAYDAIALTAGHTNPSINVMLIDDLYIYAPAGNTPFCDERSNSGVGALQNGTVAIQYPAGKPCPPSMLREPNNFWGPLLASLTIFMEQMLAPFPFHQPTPLRVKSGHLPA